MLYHCNNNNKKKKKKMKKINNAHIVMNHELEAQAVTGGWTEYVNC